jgi:hypothetical protein
MPADRINTTLAGNWHCSHRLVIIMETPKTEAGRVTERIMLRVRSKLPDLPTHEYNRTYEAVLEELRSQIPDILVPPSLHPDVAVPRILAGLKSDNSPVLTPQSGRE